MYNSPDAQSHARGLGMRAREFEHIFRLVGQSDAHTVEVLIEGMGAHKTWASFPMTKGQDRTWSVKVKLPIRTHHYMFMVNGETPLLDPEASHTAHEQCGAVSLLFARGT